MTDPGAGPPRRRRWPRLLVAAVLLGVWVLLGTAVGAAIFVRSDREVTLASHDAVLRPTLDRHAVVRTGPVLPDFRLPSGAPVGVSIDLGKTNAASTEELFDRYAFIASQPEAQEQKVRDALQEMLVSAALRGAVVGAVPVVVWVMLGRDRRRELVRATTSRRGVAGIVALGVLVTAWWQPWREQESTVADAQTWTPLGEFVGAAVPLPEGLGGLEVRVDSTSTGSRRLVESALDTYDKSRAFYATAADDAAELDLREPEEGETVALLVSDRHDNIGMDAVARAIADRAGATVVLDAGDDTSTGQAWEAFSLDSLDDAFGDLERYAIAGNHDNGDFVTDYLAERGWQTLDGEVVDAFADTSLLGVDDPRSSGLGSWRDETGLSFAEVEERLADGACAAEEDGTRISTMLVHDANLGRTALARGCVDLVLGGHTHVAAGPDQVVGENGRIGYTYTNGTTGGAAYAIAIGSKPRRPASLALVTYAEGRPSGIQAVTLNTNGVFEVDDWVPLTYE